MKKLTIKQDNFAREYAKSGNATEAAILAGYSEDTAQQIGSNILLNVVVKRAIWNYRQELLEKHEELHKQLDQFFFYVMRNDRVKWTDRIRAAESLGRRSGYYELDNIGKPTDVNIQFIVNK